MNGLVYVLNTGCQWRAVPKDMPPRSTLYDYFDRWNWDGTLDGIHDALYAILRQLTAGIRADYANALPSALAWTTLWSVRNNGRLLTGYGR